MFYISYKRLNGGTIMATPIGDTPILYGDDAVDFLNSIGKPLTKRKKEIIKRMKNQRVAYW